jgi:hypothetical protein
MRVVLFFMLLAQCSVAQELITYPPPQAVVYSMHNDDYTVRVRTPGGPWQDLFEYKVRVDLDKVQEASMVYFDMKGPVEVMVRKNNDKVNNVRIRPELYGTLKENTITFTLAEPRKLSIEFNGDTRHNLHLFARAVEHVEIDSNVVYFGPGLHLPEDTVRKSFQIPSGKTVYIHGSAVLRGMLECDSVRNVRVIGRGIIDQAREGVMITNSENVEVNGINFINPRHYTIYGGASQHIQIKNITSFSSQGWSDGIDLMSCSDVKINDIFMRNSDDCIAIYGHRWKFFGNARNYEVSNAMLWADVAHPINIGIHGNTDTLENMVFRNIHILEHDEDDPNYQGCMAITCGDDNLVRNIRFENIHVDDFEEGQLLNVRVVYNTKYNTAPGRNVRDISFRNIDYKGSNSSVIDGLDKEHRVEGVSFENIRVNGKRITRPSDINLHVGPFASGVVFK